MADDGPQRRFEPVRNERPKRQFVSGTPRDKASKILKRVVRKVQTEYTYSELGPGEDVRLLVVERGVGDIIRCRLVTSPLPPTEDKRYEALSYYWGEEDNRDSIIISTYNPSHTTGQVKYRRGRTKEVLGAT